MQKKHGKSYRRICDMRGCNKKPTHFVDWGDVEVAGGKTVRSTSEFCSTHLDTALGFSFKKPVEVRRL